MFSHSERDANNKPIVPRYGQNLTALIARYCQNRVPRSCDHGALSDRSARPCKLSESFVSSGDLVTLELRNTDTTVLRYVRFPMIGHLIFKHIQVLLHEFQQYNPAFDSTYL